MRLAKKFRGWAIAGAALAVLAGCGESKPAAPAAPVASAEWTKLVDDWLVDDFKANPTFAVYQGKHEYDGVLPDMSEAGIKAEIDRLHAWKTRAEAVDPATLAPEQKFERDYFIANIDGSLFFLEDVDWPHRNPAFYQIDPGPYLDRDYADKATRLKALTRWMSSVPAYLEQAKANLKGPIAPALAKIGVDSFDPLAGFVTTDIVEAFKDVDDAAAQAEYKTAAAGAAKAFKDFAAHLKSLPKGGTEDFAMGAENFSKMIYATERVDATLADLEAIGVADLKRNQAAMAEACNAYAPGKTVKECIAKAEANKPEGGMVEYAKVQLGELKQFVIDHNVVSIPGTEEARVKQSPPYNAQNGAYIDIPGPYETGIPSYYNIAAPDPSWPRAKQLDYISGKANLLFTSVHEVWPGHFLQFLHANRSKSIFGRVYVGYAFAEGWAHYTEELMWEMGLGAGDPETHIGQLYNATLRNVRFLSAIGMHTKGMTLAESKKMFMEEGYQDEGTADQQSARGAYDPAYLNYTMGKLMIRKLREDWCAPKVPAGGDARACWKDFHDAFLAYGGPPIPLVRGAMMNEAPKAAF
jgi:uncharacterized protein (DUF885 family)